MGFPPGSTEPDSGPAFTEVRHTEGATVTRTSTEIDRLPIYENLVRERGDAIAEAQLAADYTQHQAAELLAGRDAARQAHRRDGNTRAAAGGQSEWRGSMP